MMEIIWVILIVIVAAICAALLGKQTDRQEENIMEEKAIRFAEECYIEGIIPIQKVKRLAEFYLVEESERTIEWQEARKIEKIKGCRWIYKGMRSFSRRKPA